MLVMVVWQNKNILELDRTSTLSCINQFPIKLDVWNQIKCNWWNLCVCLKSAGSAVKIYHIQRKKFKTLIVLNASHLCVFAASLNATEQIIFLVA